MLRKILPLLLCFFGIQAFGQNNVKLYGFVREAHPGTIPKGTQENGNEIRANTGAAEYLVYISGPAGSRIYPVEIWIKGKRYDARIEKLSAPVTIDQNGEKKTLVASSEGSVMRLYPEEAGTRKVNLNVKSRVSANDVVVVYKMNGKFYTASLKKLEQLEPVFHE
jgi:hypothetical protein